MIGCGFGQLVGECASNDASPGVPSYCFHAERPFAVTVVAARLLDGLRPG